MAVRGIGKALVALRREVKVLSDFERPHSLLYSVIDNLVQENNYNKKSVA